MSGQRSDWRDRLHARPSRMEQELAIKLQEDRMSDLGEVAAELRQIPQSICHSLLTVWNPKAWKSLSS